MSSIKKECKKCIGELRVDVLPPCSKHKCLNDNSVEKKQKRNQMKKETTKKAVKKPATKKPAAKKTTKAKK